MSCRDEDDKHFVQRYYGPGVSAALLTLASDAETKRRLADLRAGQGAEMQNDLGLLRGMIERAAFIG